MIKGVECRKTQIHSRLFFFPSSKGWINNIFTYPKKKKDLSYTSRLQVLIIRHLLILIISFGFAFKIHVRIKDNISPLQNIC
jgi:hypothetical protein